MNRQNRKKKTKKQKYIITFETVKVVINKFVIPKLRKEVGKWIFHLRNKTCSPPKVRMRMGQLLPKRKQKGVSTQK